MNLSEEVMSCKDELIFLRRDFHMYPELGFEEARTSKIVGDYLESLGLEVTRKVGRTGVVGLLKGKEKGKTVMLRADMDAVPIQEMNNIPYRSQNNGIMHACGHDAHTAMLLIAAKILRKYREQIKGNIKFVFQPCEETMPGGAKAMIDDSVLEDPHIDAVFGTHLISNKPIGMIGTKQGSMLAAGDKFVIQIAGKGGHAAKPHLTVDPIVVSSYTIQALQSIVSRESDPLQSIVLTIGKIEGGTAFNVIPGTVELAGTVRTLNESLHKEIPDKMKRIIKGICEAFRTEYKFDYQAEVPLLVNDPDMAQFVKSIAKKVVGKDSIFDHQSMGYDDVSYFLSRIPGDYYVIGCGGKGTDYPHHNPHFNIDEASMSIGVEMHVRVALGFLSGYMGDDYFK